MGANDLFTEALPKVLSYGRQQIDCWGGKYSFHPGISDGVWDVIMDVFYSKHCHLLRKMNKPTVCKRSASAP